METPINYRNGDKVAVAISLKLESSHNLVSASVFFATYSLYLADPEYVHSIAILYIYLSDTDRYSSITQGYLADRCI